MYSELQLYSPFKTETSLHADNFELCQKKYHNISTNGRSKIQNVKSVVMKHLEDVEEGMEKAKTNKIGDILDSALEQDNDDCNDEGLTEHP